MAGQDRSFWIETMDKMASPVLENLARRQLSRSLPRSLHPQRGAFAPLEAFGRTLCGIAPWLNLEGLTGQEEALRQRYFELARQSIDAATDSASEDFMVWHAELGDSRWWMPPFSLMLWCGLPDWPKAWTTGSESS